MGLTRFFFVRSIGFEMGGEGNAPYHNGSPQEPEESWSGGVYLRLVVQTGGSGGGGAAGDGNYVNGICSVNVEQW